MQVFIQNEAGSNSKNYHNEKTLEWQRTVRVSRAYPYPYGFVLGTTAEDGCNVDCFVLTRRPLRSGQIVECEVVGLMEQIEDGQADHNVLARLVDEEIEVSESVQRELTGFVTHVFDHIEGKAIAVGRFLGRMAANEHLRAHLDRP